MTKEEELIVTSVHKLAGELADWFMVNNCDPLISRAAAKTFVYLYDHDTSPIEQTDMAVLGIVREYLDLRKRGQ